MNTQPVGPGARASLTVVLPEGFSSVMPSPGEAFATPEERMALAIRFARWNVETGTGGPFGAAVFDTATGTLVSAGVNLVLATRRSMAHAEVVALILAQQTFNTHDLGSTGLPCLELVTSAEPCCMCLGAVVWSGVRSLVCGARDEDIRAIGFDEGPKPARWPEDLGARGIVVRRDVGRTQAVAVLRAYLSAGGPIYNARAD